MRIFNKSKRKKLLIFLIITILFALFIMWYFDKYVNPIIIRTSEYKIKMLSSRAINSSINELLNNNASNIYDELVTVNTDNEGNISLIQANAIQINKIAKDIMRLSYSKLEALGENGISIPLGSFTGMPILMGSGPEIIVRLVPIGNIECNFISEFKQAGINQTVHRIYLAIKVEVNLVLPMYYNPVYTYTEVLICESVIIGKIPNVYLSANSRSNLLNLSP